MDPNNQNQSLDGMKPANTEPPRQPGQTSSAADQWDIDEQPTHEAGSQHVDHEAPVPSHQEVHVGHPQKKGTLKKLFVVLVVILFALATAAAVYLYNENTKLQTQIDEQKTTITKLQQQNYALQYDNRSSGTQESLLKAANEKLAKTAQELKTKCGNGCAAIVIPTN